MKKESAYFIGLGGSGMLPLATFAHQKGFRVGGSDPKLALQAADYRERGIEAWADPDPARLAEFDQVVYSSAIPASHPERSAAGARAIHRMDFLCRLAASYPIQIAVAGTHGKTTTTSLIGWILRQLGLDPAIVVGGSPLFLKEGVTVGDGQVIVYETDESDASFLKSQAAYRLCLNADRDHLETYGSMEKLLEAFAEFSRGAGLFVFHADDPGLSGLVFAANRVLGYGISSAQADFRAVIREGQLFYQGQLIARPGIELSLNALGALGLVSTLMQTESAHFGSRPMELSGLHSRILAAIASFPGVSRRLELIGAMGGVPVYDDYAHHPTEITAVIQALRQKSGRRLAVIFQPHRYTRTRELAAEFATSLAQADLVWLLPLYSAGEAPLEGISSDSIGQLMPPERYGGLLAEDSLADLPARLPKNEEFVLLGLGAGSVSSLLRATCLREVNESQALPGAAPGKRMNS